MNKKWKCILVFISNTLISHVSRMFKYSCDTYSFIVKKFNLETGISIDFSCNLKNNVIKKRKLNIKSHSFFPVFDKSSRNQIKRVTRSSRNDNCLGSTPPPSRLIDGVKKIQNRSRAVTASNNRESNSPRVMTPLPSSPRPAVAAPNIIGHLRMAASFRLNLP